MEFKIGDKVVCIHPEYCSGLKGTVYRINKLSTHVVFDGVGIYTFKHKFIIARNIYDSKLFRVLMEDANEL